MNAALTVAGWIDLAATTIVAGGLAWAAVVAPPGAQGLRAVRSAMVVLAAVLAVEFALVAVRMHDVSAVGGRALVIDLLGTRWGRLWIARAVGLGVLAALAGRAAPPSVATLAVVWLALRSFQGHAGAHGTVPALVDWLHLSAAAVWIGGLVQLALRDVGDPRVATRFRTAATAALALLVPTGIYGAFLHVPDLDRLVTSPYGRTLVAKLAVAAVLIALGAANHFRHVPAFAAGSLAAGTLLRRNVRAELALAAVVLLLSALLGVLPMPHAMP